MDQDQIGGASDAERLQALASYDILDTPAETEFDDIVRLASEACGMPVSLISLLDKDRQWFKAETGFNRRETPIGSSICAHAVQQNDLFVIPDTTKDPRTVDNPLVRGKEHVRFYAGMPLRTPEGVTLGTLCVLDIKPNSLTPQQVFVLRTLARHVMTQLELRRAFKERRESDRRNEAILASAVDYAIISMDLRGFVTGWKGGAETILGWNEQEMIGRHAHVFFTAEDAKDGVPEQEMGNALLHGRGADERWHLRKDGSLFWASGEMMPLNREDGAPQGFIKFLRDRTEQRLVGEALVQSEERWRSLFSGMQEGFFLGELIRDAENRPVDYRFLEINPAFVAQSGLPEDSTGMTIRSLVSDVPQLVFDTYARTVDTGEPQRIELEVPALDRWFEVRSHKDVGERFASLFLDITERKKAEVRRGAITELGDRLRDTSDKDVMAAAAAEIMGRALGLSHAGYGAVDLLSETVLVKHDWARERVGSLAGLHTFREYGSYIEELKAGITVVIADASDDPRTREDGAALMAIGVRALVNVPMMEHGRFMALIYAIKSSAHVWNAEEVSFIRNVADRTRAAIARVEADEQQRILNLELSHRMKNMLTMVQAIVMQTMRGATDVEVVKTVLVDRVLALSKAHDLLLGGALASTSLRALIEHALDLHRDRPDRFLIDGPPVKVGAKAATSLSLILHELATNAAKYGALAGEHGHVSLRWEVEGSEANPQVRIRWVEEGGPPVAPPARSGFGSRLIGRGLAGNFNGTAELAYPRTGATCTIVAPFRGLQAEDAPQNEKYPQESTL